MAPTPSLPSSWPTTIGASHASPQSADDAHRPLLPHEKLDRVFTWQEERHVTQNLTLHYRRIMYLLEPSELSRAAAGKKVVVRETNAGEVGHRV
jgi:hypothetical protein